MSNIITKPTCFHHPVKIVFLDDNQTFLNVLSMDFGQKENMVMLTDPDNAMLLINQSRGDIVESIRMEDSDTVDCKRGLEDNHILNIIYDKSRFDNVAVLVIDYEMPTINGIEFCKKLKDKNIYKILLTAEADKDMAISAFNSGIINKFILKTNDNLYEEILISIEDLTFKYFNELAKSSLKGGDSVKRLLNNDSYKKIFKEVMTNSDAVEYYLVDGLGSYLFLDKNAKPTWLIVCDQRKANEQADLLSGYGFAESTIKKVNDKENILFLLSDSEYKESALNLEKYIFESNKLDDDYSYSVVSGSITKSISWGSIVSHDNAQTTC